MNGPPNRWLVVALLATTLGCDDTGVTEADPEVLVTIGGLLPLSGGFAAAGRGSRAAMHLARDEVNAHLGAVGSRLRFDTDIVDTESDPPVALERIEELHERRIRLVIGAQTSSVVAATRGFVNAAGIVLVSPSSTAIELAVAGDNVFRFSPDDGREAQAVATLMFQDGIRTIVSLSRDDIAGRGLVEVVRSSFASLGGAVAGGVEYGVATPDFGGALDDLRAQVEGAVATHGAASVAVYVVAFDELIDIFARAPDMAALSSVRWYANNISFLFEPLLADPTTRGFIQATSFTTAAYAGDPAAAEEAARVVAHIAAQIGHQVDGYSVVTYDAFWVAARAFLATGPEPSTDALKAALVDAAHRHFGATGWMTLNEAGDRRFGNYDFYGVCPGGSDWKVTARYRPGPADAARIDYLDCP